MGSVTDLPTTQKDREESADFDATSNGHGDPDAAAKSLEDIEQAGVGEEDDGQMFVIEGGSKVTLGTLIKRGTPVEYAFVLGSKAIPGAAGMGLLSFADPERTLVVPGRAGKVEVDPTYDGDGNVKKVTVRAHFKPTMAYDARSEAAGVILRGE